MRDPFLCLKYSFKPLQAPFAGLASARASVLVRRYSKASIGSGIRNASAGSILVREYSKASTGSPVF
jgi:hypothetical protein